MDLHSAPTGRSTTPVAVMPSATLNTPSPPLARENDNDDGSTAIGALDDFLTEADVDRLLFPDLRQYRDDIASISVSIGTNDESVLEGEGEVEPEVDHRRIAVCQVMDITFTTGNSTESMNIASFTASDSDDDFGNYEGGYEELVGVDICADEGASTSDIGDGDDAEASKTGDQLAGGRTVPKRSPNTLNPSAIKWKDPSTIPDNARLSLSQPLSIEQETLIKQTMAAIVWPDDKIPAWAKSLPNQAWDASIVTKLTTTHQ